MVTHFAGKKNCILLNGPVNRKEPSEVHAVGHDGHPARGNARRQCEERLATISGNAGLVADTTNIEAMCADQLGMYFDENRWHKY